MPIGPEYPTSEEILEIAQHHNIKLTREHAEAYAELMKGSIQSYRNLDTMVEPKLPVKYPRSMGHYPDAWENPFNAWAWLCEIKGTDHGVLAGEAIAIKDVIPVAGMPMTCGTRLLDNYIADVDATVVTRILDAGGTISGITNTEDFSCAGSGHLCAHGPVKNPHDLERNSGASSAGSAAAIASGEIGMALGGDQGGSIRIPASWCGVYGLKPTYGLVPCTGCGMIEMTIDHIGPMANSTEGIAKLLTAIAGTDPLDPRQRGVIPTDLDLDFTGVLDRGVSGLRIALIKEGFNVSKSGWTLGSEPEVDEKVRTAAERFVALGASVEETSLPAHIDAGYVYDGIFMEGATAFMFGGNGVGNNWLGYYNSHYAQAVARGVKSQAQDLSHTLMLTLFTGEYIRRRYLGKYYRKAQNLRRLIADRYNKAFDNYDLLIMPTTPTRATKRAHRDASIIESVHSAFNMNRNTCAADVTGHPSISVPCGMSGGLPIGMMITGRHLEDATVLAASAAFEQDCDWRKL